MKKYIYNMNLVYLHYEYYNETLEVIVLQLLL